MAGMREMWQETSKGGALADFVTVFKQAGSNRWRFAALAALTTLGVFSVMSWESWKKQRALPEITYITAWPEHRSAAESRAFVEENQRRKEIREAALEAARKEERDLYKALGRASGIDVDSIEKKAAADRAAEAAAAKAKTDAILKRTAERPVAGN
ncbi:MAG: hypothetical protein ACREBO_06990 [Novosphingobium sp.]